MSYIITRTDVEAEAELHGLDVVGVEPFGFVLKVIVRPRESTVVVFPPTKERLDRLAKALSDPARIMLGSSFHVELDERADYRTPGNGG
jgi:hypothetical protein